MVLLLELLEPAATADPNVAFGAADRGCEESGLVSNHVVVQGQALSLVIPRPIRQRSLDVWKLPLGSFDWRSTAIIGGKVLFLLPEYFGYGADHTSRLVHKALRLGIRGPVRTFSQLQTWLDGHVSEFWSHKNAR